ncbi:putative amidohydrolase [Nakamurella sp. UYEF19]|uniref:nitrilase-related carbon-nitrogen hydrolase n=1 Tax=Nakamurella sp. UYEF19 TaxID=1756392 RepID=UPI0033950844
MPPFVIAVAQTPITADPRENGSAIRSAMDRAAGRGARLIQFPEGALSGYAREQIHSWQDVDWDLIGAELDEVTELAGRLRLARRHHDRAGAAR